MDGEGPDQPPHPRSAEVGLFADLERPQGLAWWWDSLATHIRELGQRPASGPLQPLEDGELLSGSLVDSAKRRSGRYGVWTSVLGHSGLIAALLLAPLLWPGDPPDTIDYVRVLIYDPPPPPPLPPPKGSEMADQAKPSKPSAPDPAPDPTPEPKLVAELEIPEELPDEIKPDGGTPEDDQYGSLTGHELGVAEGMEGGDAYFGQVGGVIGGVPGGVVGGTGTIPVFDYDRAPQPIKITKPRYPQEAFIKKIEGTVTIEILIDEKGNVVPIRILESIPLLDAAAMRTVQEWVFQPAIKNGQRVATVARAPVTFTIF